MKYIYLLAFVFISVQAKSQKLIAQTNYNHDTTGYFISDSTTAYYKASNTTIATQDLNAANVTFTADSMRAYYGTTLDLSSVSKAVYDATYTRLLSSTGDIYTNNVHTTTYNYNYFYTGAQLDSLYAMVTDILTNNTHISDKYYYHTNAQNQQDTTYYIYFNNLGAYSSSSKYVNIYTGNLLTEQLNYNSTDSINYTLSGRLLNYYNANNQYDSVVHYSWLGGIWYKIGKREFTYNANQYVMSKIWLGYDNNLQMYVNSSRDQIVRNNNTVIDTLYSQLWNQGLQKFDTTVKMAYVYQGGLLVRHYGYNLDNNLQWQPQPYNAIHHYYYDMMPNALSEPQKEHELMLYPNPAESMLYLKKDMTGKKYSIFTSDGRFVQSGIISANNQIFIQNLTPAVYSLLIEQEQSFSKAMFIKQ